MNLVKEWREKRIIKDVSKDFNQRKWKNGAFIYWDGKDCRMSYAEGEKCENQNLKP